MSDLHIQIRGTICAACHLPMPLIRIVQRALTSRRREFSVVGGHIKCGDSLELFWATNEERELLFHIGLLARVVDILSAQGVTATVVWPQDRAETRLMEGGGRTRFHDRSELRRTLANNRRGQFVVRSTDEVYSIANQIIQFFPHAKVAVLCSTKRQCRKVALSLHSFGSGVHIKSSEYERAPRVAVSRPRWYRPDQTDIVLISDVAIAAEQHCAIRSRLLDASRSVMSSRSSSEVKWELDPQRVYGFRSLHDDFGDRMDMRIEEICGQLLNQPKPSTQNDVSVEMLRYRSSVAERHGSPAVISRVTTLVDAIKNSDATQIRGLGLPSLAELIGDVATLTMAVIVDSFHDGQTLIKLHPHWNFVSCETGGEPSGSRRKAASRRTTRPDCQIITAEALRRRVTALRVDFVVWVGNRPCPEVVMAPVQYGCPVHIIDMVGTGAGNEVDPIESRTREYVSRGWAVCGD